MTAITTVRRCAVAAAFLVTAASVAAPAHAAGESTYLLRGRVVAAVTRTPLPGVCVRLESTDSWSGVELSRTSRSSAKVVGIERAAAGRVEHYGTSEDCLGGVYTDATGGYELEVTAWTMGDVTATDYAGTYVRTIIGPAGSEPGTVTDAGDTAMKVGATITGKAVDAATGLPLAGACPSAARGLGAAPTGEVSIAVVRCSGADGTWSLTGLAQGRYRVSVSALGHAVRFAPDAGDAAGAEVFRAVSGRSLDAGTVALPAL